MAAYFDEDAPSDDIELARIINGGREAGDESPRWWSPRGPRAERPPPEPLESRRAELPSAESLSLLPPSTAPPLAASSAACLRRSDVAIEAAVLPSPSPRADTRPPQSRADASPGGGARDKAALRRGGRTVFLARRATWWWKGGSALPHAAPVWHAAC